MKKVTKEQVLNNINKAIKNTENKITTKPDVKEIFQTCQKQIDKDCKEEKFRIINIDI